MTTIAPRSSSLSLMLMGATACAIESAEAQGVAVDPGPAGDGVAGVTATNASGDDVLPKPAIAGHYRYVGGAAQRDALDAAIEVVVADMNFIARPIARKRLRESNQPSAALELQVTDDEITVRRPGRPTVSAPRDGSTTTWKDPGGDEFQVQHRLVNDHEIRQHFVGEQSVSDNAFVLHVDGEQLTVTTTIAADRLPKTLAFTMSYRRGANARD
jgi:hypothetical protein